MCLKEKIISALDISFIFSFLFMSQVTQLYLYTPWVTQAPDLLPHTEAEPNALGKVMANE